MANTHNLPRAERKAAKRLQRKALKSLFASLTPKERGEYGRSERSLKGFLKEKGRL